MHEPSSFLALLTALVLDPRDGVLIALLILAAVIDCRSFRIPNWLTASGILYALLLSLIAQPAPVSGWSAIGGMLIGFVIMLPLYLMRVMGAGDVKLMAMAGAFLGMDASWKAAIFTFIVGGVLAISLSLVRGSLKRALVNIKNIADTAIYSASAGTPGTWGVTSMDSVGKLPYGVSICIGTIGVVLVSRLGFL